MNCFICFVFICVIIHCDFIPYFVTATGFFGGFFWGGGRHCILGMNFELLLCQHFCFVVGKTSSFLAQDMSLWFFLTRARNSRFFLTRNIFLKSNMAAGIGLAHIVYDRI